MFTKEQQEELFGKGVSVDELFDVIDVDGDGEVIMKLRFVYVSRT